MNVLRPIQKEFYGDDNRWFFGTVINSHPPAGLEGRVKVRINGVHSPSTGDIPEKDLPWAQVLIPTTEGGISGIGRIPQIQTGAFVFGVFLDGISSQIPLVMGSLPRTEVPSSVQSTRRVSGQNQFNYTTQRFQNVVTLNFKDDLSPESDLELRRMQCMKFFIDNGYQVIHAAAITGGLEGISSFITYLDEADQTEVIFDGVARWFKSGEVGSRYAGLLRFAAQYAPASNWKLYSVQLQYVLFELRNRYNSINSRLVQTTDIESASKIFNSDYLFSSNDTTQLAEQAYNEVIG
jgi:hypothetical protein